MQTKYFRVSAPTELRWWSARNTRWGRWLLRVICALRGHVVNSRYWLYMPGSDVPCARCGDAARIT